MTVTSQHRLLLFSLRGAAAAALVATAAASPFCARPVLAAGADAAPAGAPLLLRSGSRDPLAPAAAGGAARALGLADDGGGLLPPGGGGLLPPAGGGLVIVQHEGPIPLAWREAVERTGARVLGYLPRDAYLVRAGAAAAPALRALAGTRAVVPFRPEDRLDPALARRAADAALGAAAAAPAGAEGELVLRVHVLLDQAPEALAARVRALLPGGVVALLPGGDGGRSELLVRVTEGGLAAAAAALARDPGVEFVERAAALSPLTDQATCLLQTSTSGASCDRRFFTAAGLTGAGQVVGLADMGLDRDGCAYKLNPAGPGTPTSSTQPPGCSVTSPNEKVVVYYLLAGADDGDETTLRHGSRVAAAIAGDSAAAPAQLSPRSSPFTFAWWDAGDGMAPAAQLVVQDIGTSDGAFVAGFNQDALLSQAHCSAARVHNSSYGERPEDTGGGLATRYGSASAAIDDALWRLRDLTAVFAAGNWGAVDPQGNPWDGSRALAGLGAVAKNTVTVGASGNPGAGESAEDLVPESSRGPTLEGLLKPDVVAPGHDVTATGDDAANPPCAAPARLTLPFGTSLAAGAMSGMAVLARQYFTDGYWPGGARTRADPFSQPPVLVPSNALVKAVLVNSARSLGGTNTGDTNAQACAPPAPLWTPGCAAPSLGQGWGRVALDDALELPGDARRLRLLHDIWNGSTPLESLGRGDDPEPKGAIRTRETHNYALRFPAASSEPLKCTLAWSDPAGSPAAAAPLVNDLDLELHDPGPDCTVGTGDDLGYHGNQFHDDRPFSDPARPGWDGTNPLENVWLPSTCAGVYNLRVHGRSVPGNGRRDVVAEPAATGRIDSALQGYALLCTGGASQVERPPALDLQVQPSPAVGCVEDPASVTFRFVEVLCPSPGTCVRFDWDFGDGETRTTATGDSGLKTYAAAGLYLVTATGLTAAGVEGRSAFPVEVIVGNRLAPTTPVGSSLRLVEDQGDPTGALVSWSDLPVPATTWYNLFEFADKRVVSSLPPAGTQLNTPPGPLHGTGAGGGFRWSPAMPPPPSVRFLQVRASSCVNESGP